VDRWDSLGGWTHAQHPAGVALVAGLLALVAVVDHRAWRVSRNVVTIAHEGGHALVALLTGRTLNGIRLHSDTSGVTISTGRSTGPGMVATAAAGYVAPSLLGLGAAALLAAGHVTVLLWTSLTFVVALLLLIRNAYGALSLVVTGALVGAAAWLAPVGVQAGFAYLETWFLLLGGVRPVFELGQRRRRGHARWSDADQLARLTRVPGGVWVGLFGVVTLVTLALGVGMLGTR
jgi:Peptidase M50B-like